MRPTEWPVSYGSTFSLDRLSSCTADIKRVLIKSCGKIDLTDGGIRVPWIAHCPFVCYGHLKSLSPAPLWVAILVSCGIAFFEYTLQVPANRLGFETLSVGQLKVMQEVITLLVFVPFSIYFMQQPLKLDYLWAGLCLVGAVYFVFRA